MACLPSSSVLTLTSSLLVDGLSIAGALESAGAGDGEDEAVRAALGMGQAIYEAWAND